MKKIKPIKENFISLLPLILILNLFVIIIYYSITYTETKLLQEYLIRIEPIFLSINFGLLIIFLILNLKDLKKMFKPIKKTTWVFLLIILFLGFYLRMYVAPRTHRVYFDEDIYLDMGKEIATEGKGCLCNYGDQNGCKDCILMKWPAGYPFTLALSYLLTGISENSGYNLTVFLSTLSILLVFLIGYLLSREGKIGLYAALLLALVPMYIIWSNSTAAEPTFNFFILLVVFSFLYALKNNTWKAITFAIICLAFAPQIRTEGVTVIVLTLAIIFFLDKKFIFNLNQKNLIIPVIIMFILLTPYLIHVYHASKTETWGEQGERFSFEHLKNNVPINLGFWITGYPTIEHPTLFTIFAVIGLVYTVLKQKKIALILCFWFLMFFLLYSSFYAGNVKFGIDVRYALNNYPPFVLLGGYGLFFIHQGLKKFLKKDLIIFFALTVLTIAYFIYFFVPAISLPADKIVEANQARVYHDRFVEYASKLDKNCYILSHVPSMYLIENVGSLQTWNGQNEKTMESLFKKTDCVIFDDGFWCNIEPYKSSVCKHMFDRYNITELTSVAVDEGRHSYTLYKVSYSLKLINS